MIHLGRSPDFAREHPWIIALIITLGIIFYLIDRLSRRK